MPTVLWITPQGGSYFLVYPTLDTREKGDVCYLPWEIVTFRLEDDPFAIPLKPTKGKEP